MLKKVSSRVRAVSSKTSVAEISISGFPGGLGRGNNLKKNTINAWRFLLYSKNDFFIFGKYYRVSSSVLNF